MCAHLDRHRPQKKRGGAPSSVLQTNILSTHLARDCLLHIAPRRAASSKQISSNAHLDRVGCLVTLGDRHPTLRLPLHWGIKAQGWAPINIPIVDDRYIHCPLCDAFVIVV